MECEGSAEDTCVTSGELAAVPVGNKERESERIVSLEGAMRQKSASAELSSGYRGEAPNARCSGEAPTAANGERRSGNGRIGQAPQPFQPPDADPHVRWCGRGRPGLIPAAPISISKGARVAEARSAHCGGLLLRGRATLDADQLSCLHPDVLWLRVPMRRWHGHVDLDRREPS